MYEKSINYLNEEILKPYLEFTNYNKEEALFLYNLNIKISENFHTPLDHFEIIFRNSINITSISLNIYFKIL